MNPTFSRQPPIDSRKRTLAVFLILIVASSGPFSARAQIEITEIMYDVPASDSGKEWIEIYNNGQTEISLTGWKFNDGSNHVLSEPPKNGGTGSLVVPAGGRAVLAADASEFLRESTVSVSVIDTVMSLGQQDDKEYALQILDADGGIVDSVKYKTALGAKGDGNSLQKNNGVWAAAAPTPGSAPVSSGNAEVSQGESVATSSQPAQPVESGSAAAWPVGPQIFARIKGSSRLVAGADQLFEAEAAGTEKQPIPNARFIWNFGDGSSAEGERVLHHYQFPGSYIVVLEAASGGYAASDRLDVLVVPAELSIVSVVAGPTGRAVLRNDSPFEIDLSWWRFKSGNQFFTFPKNTRIRPKTDLTLAASVLKMSFDPDVNELWYPNGSVAVLFKPVPAEKLSATVPVQSVRNVSGKMNPENPPEAKPAASLGPEEEERSAAALVLTDTSFRHEGGGGRWLLYAAALVCLGVLAWYVAVSKKREEKLSAQSFEIID